MTLAHAELLEFMAAVHKMREAQDAYHNAVRAGKPSRGHLVRCIKLERAVDSHLARYIASEKTPDLFAAREGVAA